MRESRWRSVSIMDLNLTKRRSGGVMAGFGRSSAGLGAGGGVGGGGGGGVVASAMPISTAGQSYELIKSTQSLVDRLHLSAGDISIQPVHPSIIGQDTWFQITYSAGNTRYFSCQNSRERDEWIASLKKTLMLTEDRRRTDNTLRLAVLEAKGLRDKRKYYVEIHVDDKLYARTAAKKMTGDMCFWGEHFEFGDLPPTTDRVSLLIFKDKGNGATTKKPKKPVGRVKMTVVSVQSRYMQEKWHPVEKSSRRESPSIRLKCQYASVDILPIRDYDDLLYFLRDEYKTVCRLFEPNISVKVKEELAQSLMAVFHAEDMAEDVLAEIVVDEISSVENEHLTFRGNSIATKAMEAYLKLVGQRYLQSTLQSVLTEIILSEVDLEVDPLKVNSAEALNSHRQNLRTVVKQVWSRVAKSYAYFPVQLQRCFHKIRQYLEHVGKPELGDNLISSCIFLRYICPAVLAPSLFSLADEFPSERANRNLTLVTKALQTLANFTRYEGKENAMEFLNTFLEEEAVPMRNFLRQISSPLADDAWIPALSSPPPERTDLARNLSLLHTVLLENVSKIAGDHPKAQRLRHLLDDLNGILHRPTIPLLEQISQPTTTTLRQIQEQKNPGTSSTSFPWSWTLPKKSKAGLSHPAPHHEAPKLMAKPEPGISMSSDTSSSPSLSPSPSARPWSSSALAATKSSASSSSSSASAIIVGQATTDLPMRRHKAFPSSASLDDTDSSDDSTYSSQYQSDATSTPRFASTLPRPVTGGGHGYAAHARHNAVVRASRDPNSAHGKTLSDYETEILELRSAMETLQMKLVEAERRLQSSSASPGTPTSDSDAETAARRTAARLLQEEERLRRDHASIDAGDKERMIIMQQQKIAALDQANCKLIEELNRLGEKLSVLPSESPTSDAAPKTVEELLDSLHSTPI